MSYDLVIGIPIFNRPNIVKYFATSIKLSSIPDKIKFLIIDDASTDFDAGELNRLFPNNFEILRNSENSGNADSAIRNLLLKCTEFETKFILLLDSDMLVRSDFIVEALKMMKSTDGILSIFNSKTHKYYSEDEQFLIKESIGSAGTIFEKNLATNIINNVDDGPSFDFRYCKFLKDQKIRLLCTKLSLIQHIGFSQGQNSSGRNGDIGIGFFDYTIHNSYIMNEVLLNEIQKLYNLIEEKRFKRKFKMIKKNIRNFFGM